MGRKVCQKAWIRYYQKHLTKEGKADVIERAAYC